jgi:hypothetical protein
MNIVIDIPNWLYNAIMEHREPVYSQSLGDAVRDGTPLPKGHGDLIDRKELLKQPMDLANYPSNYVRIAPPIIEADAPKRRKGTPLEENDNGYLIK